MLPRRSILTTGAQLCTPVFLRHSRWKTTFLREDGAELSCRDSLAVLRVLGASGGLCVRQK